MFRLPRVWILFLVLCGILLGLTPLYAQQNALAIFNLIPTHMEAMGYNGDILYAIVSTLEKEKIIPVMPRREMEEILFHAGIVQGDNVEMVLKAGKVLNTRFILFGQVTKTDKQIEACLRLMDIKKGSVVKTWTPAYLNRDAILSGTQALARELIEEVLRDVQPDEPAVVISEDALPRVEIKYFRAELQENKVLLKWEIESWQPATGFNLYRSENPDGPYQHLGRVTKNSFVDISTKKGRLYFYRLGTLAASGDEIKFDQTVRIRSVSEKLPHPPLILEGRGHIRRTVLKFVPSLRNEQERFSIREYKIYRRNQPRADYENIITIPAKLLSQSELTFQVEDNHGLEDNETYMYAVSSLDREERESPLSDPVSITTVARPVLSLIQDQLLRRTLLAWEPLEKVGGYHLYRHSDGKNWERVGRIDDALTSKIEDTTGLDDATDYEYYLHAFDAKGETGPSNLIKARTKELPQPPADLLTEDGLVKSVRLSWTPISDPDVGGYIVYRGTQLEVLKQIAKIKEFTVGSYLDKGSTFASLEDGTTYHYVVSSFNRFGAEGMLTPAATARTKPRPITVQGLSVKAGEKELFIQWDPNPEVDIERYILSRSRNNGFWFEVSKTGADETSYSDTDLKPDSQYRYRIIVQDKDGLQSDPVQSGSIPSPLAKPQR